jgi:hypothetical protein
MQILIMLIILSIISIFIPHNDKEYNFSWHSRLIITLTLFYTILYFLYKSLTILIKIYVPL